MINVSINDDYSIVYELIRMNRYEDSLSMILNVDGNSINEEFQDDLNHSYYIVGDIFYKIKNYDKAIIFFKRAIKEWPDDNDAKLAVINCLFESNRILDAISFIEGEVLPTNDTKLLYNYGNILADMHFYGKAISILRSIRCYDRKLRRSIYKNIRYFSKKLNG